ncbi:hypothetical protein, partial [Candidatus Symbiothrix dinenymphae]|uniref:hypothetical protein n=1 Tax=Candidatus Symbiothrix dinenymphae TaxID=467085 RepID=UPI000A87E576
EYTAVDYTETQGISMLSIPLMAHYQVYPSGTDKSYQVYFKFGGKFKLPLNTPLSTYNGTLGRLDVKDGVIPDLSIAVPDYMMKRGSVEKSHSGPIELSGYAVLGSLEVGKKWGRLTEKWSLYAGIYADYAILNKITAKTGDKKPFITTSDDGQMHRANGILVAQKFDGTPFVDNRMLSPLSVGVKVGIAYGNRPRKKLLVPPVLQLKYPASYI